MSLHVLPIARNAGTTAPDAPQQPGAADRGGFAQVIELESARAARRDRIPTQVLDEVDAASRLYDELWAEGLRLRFDMHRLKGRVVCDLIDTEGKVLRPISLRDALGAYCATPPPDPEAA
jgi:hypothetical protein